MSPQKMKVIPLISVVIPVRNEQDNLSRLIPSLAKQVYPRNKIDYIFVDDNSSDNSRKLAEEFEMRIISVNTSDIELNKGIGMHEARGEFILWLDADMEICTKDFFNHLIAPLAENPNITGSFTNEFALDRKSQVKNSLLRFISYDPLQRDPIYQFFSPSIESTIITKKRRYSLCKFIPGRIPPCGRMMYRKEILEKTNVWKNKAFIDLEALEIVSRSKYQLFSYVSLAKIRHYHVKSLKELIKKRLRNLERDYLPNLENKYYTWFDKDNPKDILKIIFWVIWVNLFFPELVRGIIKAVIHKDHAFLWQPIVSLSITDAIIWGFVSKSKGRDFTLGLIKRLLK